MRLMSPASCTANDERRSAADRRDRRRPAGATRDSDERRVPDERPPPPVEAADELACPASRLAGEDCGVMKDISASWLDFVVTIPAMVNA